MKSFSSHESADDEKNIIDDLTIDFAIAFAGVPVLLENKNLVFLGTSTEKG